MFCKLILPSSSGVTLGSCWHFFLVFGQSYSAPFGLKRGEVLTQESWVFMVGGRTQQPPLVLLEAQGHCFSCRARPHSALPPSPARPVHASFSLPAFSFGSTFWGRERDYFLIWSCSPLVTAVSICWFFPQIVSVAGPQIA